jgi:hypothetical protein
MTKKMALVILGLATLGMTAYFSMIPVPESDVIRIEPVYGLAHAVAPWIAALPFALLISGIRLLQKAPADFVRFWLAVTVTFYPIIAIFMFAGW